MSTGQQGFDYQSDAIIDLSTQLSEREQLRAEARLAMSGSISPADLGVLTAAGLLGVLPALPLGRLPEQLYHLMVLIERGRDVAISAGGGPLTLAPSAGQVLELLREHCPPELQWLSMFWGDDQVNALADFAPSLPGFSMLSDAVGHIQASNAGAVTALTELWCSHRGLIENSQIYHEFHALSHGLGACVSAFVTPDPFLIGAAGWHIFRALQSSRKQTAQLALLVSIAAEESARTNRAYDHEVSVSKHSALGSLGSLGVGDVGDADLLFPTTKSKKRW